MPIRHGFSTQYIHGLSHVIDDAPRESYWPSIPVVQMTLDDYEKLILLANETIDRYFQWREKRDREGKTA